MQKIIDKMFETRVPSRNLGWPQTRSPAFRRGLYVCTTKPGGEVVLLDDHHS